MGKAVELVKKLKVVEFDWKDTGKSEVGFIAEEVARVFPEAVYHNAQGQVEGIKLLPIIALLVEAVKELGG